jgi:hypothetical protein
MPIRKRVTPAELISCKGSGVADCAAAGLSRALRGATVKGRSSNEFHPSHCGQRPSQRVDSNPHAEQK